MVRELISRGPSAWSLVWALARRLPFTLALVAAVLLITLSSAPLHEALGSAALERWGFSLADLESGRLLRLLTCPFHVLRLSMLLSIVGSLLLFVGACEYLLGTRRAALAFLAGHVAGYLGGFLLLAGLGRLGLEWASGMAMVRDVGASAGAFGAAGAAVAFLPPRQRRGAFLVIAAYLVLALIISTRRWDFEHAVAFPAGFVLGGILLVRQGRAWPIPWLGSPYEQRLRTEIMAGAVGIMGFLDVLGGLVPLRLPGLARAESMLPLSSPQLPHHLMVVTGCALLLLAPPLARGRRLAWWGTVVALLVSFIFHLRTGVPRLETGLALGFLLLLLAWAGQFQAGSGAVTLRRGRRMLWAMLLFLPLYGMLGFWLLRTRFGGLYHPLRALERTAACLLFSAGGSAPTSDVAQGFLASIPLLGWVGLLYGLALLLRGATGAVPLRAEQQAARRIVAAHGRSGTAYMTLWPGNSLFLGPGEQSYLAYRVCADVAVVLGDPIGPPESGAALVKVFIEHALTEGWEAVFYAATEELLPIYRGSGYEALQIGEEAVIPLAGLEFKGKEWQTVRSAINRASREKLAFQLYEGGSVPAPVREQLFAISAAWQAQRKLPPMEFTLGRTEDVDDPNVAVAAAVGADGLVHAFADWLPVHARRGWVIDLMRRRADSMSGAMEFLIASSLLAFRDRGYAQASLATAPLANLDRNSEASLLQQVLGLVYDHFDTYYRFKSLFEFKDKFQPRWEGIYLVHPGVDRLPRVVQALVQAHLPGLDVRKVLQILGSSVAGRLFAGDDAADA